jgi:hypothetical protein
VARSAASSTAELSLIAGPNYKTALDLSVAATTGQQLFLAGLRRELRPPASAAPLTTHPVSALTLVTAPKRTASRRSCHGIRGNYRPAGRRRAGDP